MTSIKAEEEDHYDEEVKSDTDSENNDAPDLGDNIDVVDSEGHTLTGQIMLAWKANRADILHDFACAAMLLLPNSIVHEYVVKHHVQADRETAELAKWLIPEGTLRTERYRFMASLVPTLWKEWGE